MLVVTGFTPLLVNLESMTAKPQADGGNKNCVAWKVEKAVHYFAHTDKVTTDYGSTDYRKVPQSLESCLTWDVEQSFYKLHRTLLNAFKCLAIPFENGGGCLQCIFKMRDNKRFVREEENSRGQGCEGSLWVNKHATGFFVAWAT